MSGRFELKAKRRDQSRAELLRLYEENPGFMLALVDVWSRYRRLLEALIRCERGQTWGADRISQPEFAFSVAKKIAIGAAQRRRGSSAPRRVILTHLNRYLSDLDQFARHWGLRATWTKEWLHVGLIGAFILARFGHMPRKPFVGKEFYSYNWAAPDDAIGVAVGISPRDHWLDVMERALNEVRSQWEDFRKRWDLLPEWERRNERPELSKHLTWLYLRICPQPSTGRPRTWASIAESNHVQVTTVTRVVKELANELEIQLPRFPPGRPSALTR